MVPNLNMRKKVFRVFALTNIGYLSERIPYISQGVFRIFILGYSGL